MKKEITSIDSLNLDCQFAFNENRGSCWVFDKSLKDLEIKLRMLERKKNLIARIFAPKVFNVSLHVLFFVDVSVNRDIRANEAEFIAIDKTDGKLYKIFYEYEMIEPPDEHFFLFDPITKEKMLEYAEEYFPEAVDKLKKYKYENFKKFLDIQYIDREDMGLFA